jgi:hypothetical protein
MSTRLGWGCWLVGVSLGASLGLSCGASPPPDSETAPAPLALAPVAAGAARGVRVDLHDKPRHVRGLQRQPDGTYKSVCFDAPEGLRPAGPLGDAGARGTR